MDSSSCDQLPSPKSLQFLACDVKCPSGNNLIHQLVLNNRKPSDSCSESDLRAALRSFPGARVNDYNREGHTALHLAVTVQSSFMVKMLLSSLPTIDVNAKCKRGTALHLAAAGNDFDDVLIIHGRTTLDDNAGGEEESLEIVKALIEYGASVEECDDDGDTPLYNAARCNQIDIIRHLISKGADVNANNGIMIEYNPLHAALEKGHLEAVLVLVDGGASLDASYIDGSTPLQFAVERNRIDALQLLISRGADVNAKDGGGNTPLHVALEKGHSEAVAVLIESGASVEEPSDRDGRTPLHFAAAGRSKTDALELLISRGTDVNAKDKMGQTPLYGAVVGGSLEAVKVLIENDAHVNVCDWYGATLLHFAARYNRIDALELLIGKGLDVNAKDRCGCTPLHTAVVLEHLETVKLLVESGADVDVNDKYGDTALRIAEKQNLNVIVNYLNSRVSSVNVVDRDGRIASSDFRVIRLRGRSIVPEGNGKMEEIVEPPCKKRRKN